MPPKTVCNQAGNCAGTAALSSLTAGLGFADLNPKARTDLLCLPFLIYAGPSGGFVKNAARGRIGQPAQRIPMLSAEIAP